MCPVLLPRCSHANNVPLPPRLPQVEEHEEQGTLFVSVLQYCIVLDEECGGLSEGQEDQDSDVCDSR